MVKMANLKCKIDHPPFVNLSSKRLPINVINDSNNYNPSWYQQMQQIIKPIDNNNQPSKVLQNHQINHAIHDNNNNQPLQPQQMQYDNHPSNNYSPSWYQRSSESRLTHHYC